MPEDNFQTKNYEEAIAEASFGKLNEGVLDFIDESHFKRFVMIIKSAGFITTEMIRTQGALNFAYLRLHSQASVTARSSPSCGAGPSCRC
ncbi:MAG: hypothetical protein ACYC5S_00230 [Thiobacillus sp.]